MKGRWIALYVENQVGVLAKISGLFAGKSYNLKSLTVGTTEEEDTSRITISTMCDDITFEQIKKQLNPYGRGHQSHGSDQCADPYEGDHVCKGKKTEQHG